MSRYDDMSDAARNLMAGFDEIDLAEIAADAQEALARARNQLAALHQGEMPPGDDEAVAPTPAQWLWRWNRATPERRLELAAIFLEETALARHCQVVHRGELAELREALGHCSCQPDGDEEDE